MLVAGVGRFAIALLGNPRFSEGLRPAFLHGETDVSPTPFLCNSGIYKTRNNKRASLYDALLLFLVAGTGIAPMARGYEPLEILLLHPAIISSEERNKNQKS